MDVLAENPLYQSLPHFSPAIINQTEKIPRRNIFTIKLKALL